MIIFSEVNIDAEIEDGDDFMIGGSEASLCEGTGEGAIIIKEG